MKKFILSVILCGFLFCEGAQNNASKDVCELEFIQNEIAMTTQNKEAYAYGDMATFDDMKCENGVVTFEYTYKPKYSADLEKVPAETKQYALNHMKSMMSAMFCNMPELELHRKNNLIMRYLYSTTNVKNFYEVEVSNKDCKK